MEIVICFMGLSLELNIKHIKNLEMCLAERIPQMCIIVKIAIFMLLLFDFCVYVFF